MIPATLLGSFATGLHFISRVRFVAVALLFAACSVATAPAHTTSPSKLSRDSWRFEISATTDSTVVFGATDAKWVRPGMPALAIDPSKHDTLVATLTIVRVDAASFSALITGQVRPVSTSHVVVVERAKPQAWLSKDFWKGAAAGAFVAALIALGAK